MNVPVPRPVPRSDFLFTIIKMFFTECTTLKKRYISERRIEITSLKHNFCAVYEITAQTHHRKSLFQKCVAIGWLTT